MALAPLVVAALPELIRLLETAMGSKSKGKGARGEREIVALLRSVLPDGWTVERFGTGESGHDVRLRSPDGSGQPFAIEVKRYRDFSIGEVLRGPSARWLSWWLQACDQAERVGREPVLLTRGDRRPWWLWTRHQYGEAGPFVELRFGAGRVVVGAPLSDALADLAMEITQEERRLSERGGEREQP